MIMEQSNEKNSINKNKVDSKPLNEVKNSSDLIFYGEVDEVVPVGTLDFNDFIKENKAVQKMNGFDSKYRDIVDYIIKITHNIWEEKGIGTIYETYHNNVIIHAGSENSVGINGVISGTLQTLHAFPDRRLIGQNVVWSKHGADGYYSSHRILSTATNINESSFGQSTGKKINFRTVADCAVSNNRIFEEWLVRDNLWIVTQLGFDPNEIAQKMAVAARNKRNTIQTSFGLCESMEGQYMPVKYEAKDDSVGEMMLEMCNSIYNCKNINEVKKYYHENAVLHYICNRDLVGYDQIQGMIVSFLSSVPNGSYEVDRVTCTARHNNEGYDVAVRWRLRGLEEGLGLFGEPSMKPLEIMGINQYHVVNGKIKEEWDTFDGLDVLKQKFM